MVVVVKIGVGWYQGLENKMAIECESLMRISIGSNFKNSYAKTCVNILFI
jgi:hypothetical protein